MLILTAHDKLDAIKRELSFRQRVYPRMIETKRMAVGKAAREIAIMEAIRDDYEREAEKERLL